MHGTGMNKEDFIEAFKATTDDMVETVIRKNHDYTSSDTDPFDNFNAVEALGICSSEIGILVRMTDKIKRIISLLQKGEGMVKDESIEDTMVDLANYSIILKLRVRNRRWQAKEPTPIEEMLKKTGSSEAVFVPC
jgi:hypothetical protein